MKNLDGQQLKALCDVFGETSSWYTESELTHLLQQNGIAIVSDGSKSDGYMYQIGSNRRQWPYHCFQRCQ